LIYIYLALLIDFLIGDPYFLPHPVRFIGFIIERTEKWLRKLTQTSQGERVAGYFLTLISALVVVASVWIILSLAKFNFLVYAVINTYLLFSCFASTCLAKEAKKVYKALRQDDMELAGKSISYLVGRNTENLSKQEVIRAAVETVAENTSDGVIAPLFYAFLGGAPLAFLYKTINTLDSMVGYTNEKYKNIGFLSAKADDILNYIPARFTGILMVLASYICGYDAKGSLKILIRDRRNHKSPNCGYPEAATAGALNVQLGGANYYFGEKVDKETIGDKIREIETDDILKAIRIMYVTSILCAFILGIIFFAGRQILI